jgi:hypothetical protein
LSDTRFEVWFPTIAPEVAATAPSSRKASPSTAILISVPSREGHLFRRVDALLGQTAEPYGLVPRAEAKLEPWRHEAKLVERIDVQLASAGLRR